MLLAKMEERAEKFDEQEENMIGAQKELDKDPILKKQIQNLAGMKDLA